MNCKRTITLKITAVFLLLGLLITTHNTLPGFRSLANVAADEKTKSNLLPPPTLGDLIFNEYAADNDANGNDFFELLVITDNLDLRGMRFTDNELIGGTLNNNESVFIFGNDAFLNNIPKGTTIAVWTMAIGVTTDTTTNPAGGDWKMVLAPGTGVTTSIDGLGGAINTGFANGGDALYIYLTGADGTSAGTDNVYFDFVSFENDGGAEAPAGLADINLPSLADNAYYRGNTAAGNDTAANWTTYDFPPTAPNVPTPGDANPSQDLSNLRVVVNAAPTISENTATPLINLPANGAGFVSGVIGDATDPARILGIDFTINDTDTPIGSLTVTATSNNQTVVPNANLNLTGSGAARNLKITPAAVGYATITVAVTDGTSTTGYIINYAASAASATPMTTIFHTGKADASTAVAVDADYMFVADDEDQTIRLYDRNESGLPLSSFDFTTNLGLTDISGGVPREVDIEASAQNGSRIYWLGSHSNSSGGGNRPNRSRLFATDVSGTGAATTLTYVGRYDGLKADLIAWDNSNGHGLGAQFFGLSASATTGVIPEAADGSGFNIEGLVFAPDNTTAYVCFRAPIAPAANRTKALIVPVTNFASLVSGNPGAGPATFGAPIQLNLGGLGIREIKRNAANEYLIIAGSASSAGVFRIYSWTGNPANPPIQRTTDLSGLNPESIVEVPNGINSFASLAELPVQFVSDNGDTVFYGDSTIAKDLANNEFKKFRSDVRLVGFAASAASVNVSGRVLNAANTGIPKARVSLTGADGIARTVLTNPFGYYLFEEVQAGAAYIFQVNAKRYVFAPQVITVNEEITDLDFVSSQ